MKPTLSGFTLALAVWATLLPGWTPALRADSPAADFSATMNPNGVWRYGYITAMGKPLNLYTTPANFNGIVGWNNSGDGTNDPPEVLYNNTSGELTYFSFNIEPGEIVLHPGVNGELSILRYTASAGGQYAVSGSYYGRDVDGTTTDVHLLVNGASVFDGEVNGYGPGTGPSFNQNILLYAGDTLDFAVGYGTNGNYFNDSTALVANLSYSVAQPAVILASPPPGITVAAGSALPLAASAVDPSGILASVQFFIDGQPVAAALTKAPFVLTTTAPTAPGAHTVQAVATDTQGRQSTGSVTINVAAATTAPPVSGLLTPINGLNLKSGATITLTATAAAASTALAQTVIYVDGAAIATFDGQGNPITDAHGGASVRRQDAAAPVGNAFSAPYTLPGSDKLLNMIVVAFDQLGLSSVSGVATVHSTVTSDKAPLVAISNLAATALVAVGSANTVDVAASDPDAVMTTARPRFPGSGTAADDSTLDGVLAKLGFYINGALTDLLDSPSASSSFAFSPPASGKYVLHSVATDGSGLSTVSDPVVVTAGAAAVVTMTPAGDGTAVAGGANGKVIVERTGDTGAALTVRYKVKGTAKAGVDYKPLPGTVTIPAGAAKVKIKLKPLDDPDPGTRKAKLRLLPADDGSYTLGDPSVAKIKLIDNG